MASTPEPVMEAGVLSPANKTVQRSPSRVECEQSPLSRPANGNGPNVLPRDIDSISIDSTQSVPGVTGCKTITFEDERTKTAYEAWEFVCIKDKYIRRSWTTFCGINFGTRWSNNNDGCILASPVVSFGQGELADMYEDAIRKCKRKNGASQQNVYEQDLANRAKDLPEDVYDHVQQLIEDKTFATNSNPYRRREWRVVVLQPREFRMTDLLPKHKRKSIFTWKKQPPVSPAYFVILRGKEVKSTKEDGGWKVYNRSSNPWWRLDKRETKEERDQHKDAMKKIDRARDRRQQQSEQRAG